MKMTKTEILSSNKANPLIIKLAILLFAFFIAISSAYAAEKDEFVDDFGEDETSLGFQTIFSGFIEIENFIHNYRYEEPGDANKKNEFRAKLSLQLGTENTYFKIVPNFYALPAFGSNKYPDYVYAELDPGDKYTVARNGRISGKYYEASFNECYVNLGFDFIKFRLGNQIYAWGTADLYNPTSYINPSDTRELFYKDADESKPGVPSVSAMVFISDFTLELVYIPVHTGSISPVPGNFWRYHYNLSFIELQGNEDTELPVAKQNMGYAARLSSTFGGVDISISGYRGPDTSPLLRPMAWIGLTSDVEVEQEYHISNNAGIDFSFSLGDFELHGEAAYSPDKYGVVDEEYGSSLGDEDLVLLPFRIRTSGYYSYAAGFNYTHGKLIFTAEWVQSKYTDKELMAPFYSDIIGSSISYSLFEELINLSLIGAYHIKNHGYILSPAVSFEFDNGLSFKLSYGYIGAEESDEPNMFTLYEMKKIFIVGVRYVF
ncbi:MAG TPA: hypothetical protein PK514_13010 [Spirochaetota bacterium]|nr:hypothetical protein [Spirochaetota bacterium]